VLLAVQELIKHTEDDQLAKDRLEVAHNEMKVKQILTAYFSLI